MPDKLEPVTVKRKQLSHSVAAARPRGAGFLLSKTPEPPLLEADGMDTKQIFQAVLDDWAAAIVANDAPAIGRFAMPDWVIVGPEGGPGTRDRFLELVASGELTHSEMSFEVLEARVFGAAAVAVAHCTNKGTWQDQAFSSDEWSTNTFLRQGDQWVCTVTALTPNYAALQQK